MRKAFLALLFVACLTEPEVGLEAGYVDSDSLVTFWAQAPDTLFWKVEWIDHNILFDYGQAVYEVEVPVSYSPGYRFWLDFTAWTPSGDTVVVTFMGG